MGIELTGLTEPSNAENSPLRVRFGLTSCDALPLADSSGAGAGSDCRKSRGRKRAPVEARRYRMISSAERIGRGDAGGWAGGLPARS